MIEMDEQMAEKWLREREQEPRIENDRMKQKLEEGGFVLTSLWWWRRQ